MRAEIDIWVSVLLGSKTFANFFRVSVSENLVSEKKLRFQKKISLEKKSRFRFWEKSLGSGKIWSRKKVSVSVSENLVSEKKKSK